MRSSHSGWARGSKCPALLALPHACSAFKPTAASLSDLWWFCSLHVQCASHLLRTPHSLLGPLLHSSLFYKSVRKRSPRGGKRCEWVCHKKRVFKYLMNTSKDITVMVYYCTAISTSNFKKTNLVKCWEWCGTMRNFMYCWWDRKLIQAPGGCLVSPTKPGIHYNQQFHS